MSESIPTADQPVILPFQQATFDRLCAVARSCLYVDREAIKCLKLRASFLLIGRTGSGKTHLARALAQEMQVPFFSVAVSDWIILGGSNRGSSTTWPSIMEFIVRSRNKRGAIIFIDELDKCADQSNWNSFLRSEIFSLCDSRIPVGIQDKEGDTIAESRIAEAESFLAHKTIVIAGAAFQEIWENRSAPTMGFNPAPKKCDDPELPDLTKVLPRELINRFSSQVFILPELSRSDYRIMVEAMAEKIPSVFRNRFVEIGIDRLDLAVSHQKGARYLEEVLLSAVVEERAALTNFIPNSDPVPEPEKPVEDLDLHIF